MDWRTIVGAFVAVATTAGALVYAGVARSQLAETSPQLGANPSSQAAIAALKQRLAALESAGPRHEGKPDSESRALAAELRRLDEQLKRLESKLATDDPIAEPQPETPQERIANLNLTFEQLAGSIDAAVTQQMQTALHRAVSSSPALAQLEPQSMRCKAAGCLAEVLLPTTVDLAALYPSLLVALGDSVDQTEVVSDGKGTLTFSLSLPRHLPRN